MRSIRWKFQPPRHVEINKDHWATKYAERVWLPTSFVGNETTGSIYDAVSKSRLSTAIGGDGGTVNAAYGARGVKLTSSQRSTGIATKLSKIQAANRFTILVYMNSAIPGASRGLVGVDFGGATGAGEVKIQWYTDNNFYFDIGNEVERIAQSDTSIGDYVFAFTWDGTNKKIYRNGLLIGQGTDPDALSGDPTYVVGTGLDHYLFAAFAKDFTADQVFELNNNPYALLTPRRRRYQVKTASTGAISGTATLVFGQSGVLTAGGALGGAAALTFGQIGALTGAGALNGSSAINFGQTGVITGAGALAGTTPLVFGQTGTLAGAGALAGTTTITFGATGTLDQPGALVGSASLTFGQSGTLTASGALAGSALLTFGASGTLDQPQASGGMGPMGPLYPSGRYIPMAANIGYDKPKKEELEEEVEEIEAVVEVAPPPKRPILTLKRPALDLPALQAIESEFSSLKSLAKAAQEVARLKKLQADDDEIVALLLL